MFVAYQSRRLDRGHRIGGESEGSGNSQRRDCAVIAGIDPDFLDAADENTSQEDAAPFVQSSRIGEAGFDDVGITAHH